MVPDLKHYVHQIVFITISCYAIFMNTDTSLQLLNNFSLFFAVGLGTFIVAMFGMIALFGWSARDTLKHAKGMTIVLVFSLLTPFIIGRLYLSTVANSQASQQIQVLETKVSITDSNIATIKVWFSFEVNAYMEYVDYNTNTIIPILSTTPATKNRIHTFVVRNIGKNGGYATVVVNGVKQLIKGEPLRILPQ